jgi:hydrogenase expression/formation protein HypC
LAVRESNPDTPHNCAYQTCFQRFATVTLVTVTWITAVVDGRRAPVVHQDSASREDRIARTQVERGDRGIMCLAIPGQVIELVDEANQIAKVDVVGVRRNINVSLLASDGDEARPGDWVLIHVGFALSKVDEEEAHATLALLQGMGRDYEQELEELKASVIE